VANASRNARAGAGRRRRWAPARDALWDFVAPVLDQGGRVAIVGAGNCDTVPLRRIARRAGSVVLIDIDPRAARGARRGLRRRERRRVEVVGHDVTVGAADAAVRVALGTAEPPGERVAETATPKPAPQAAADGELAEPRSGIAVEPAPLPGAPYDLAIGDLFYSQLLYPALLDLGVADERIDATIADRAPGLTRAAVARLHASSPLVVHVHDPLAWWDGHEQPVSLEEILDLAGRDGDEAALALLPRGNGPHESDPRDALAALGVAPTATALWHWPFAEGVDYLACATLANSRT
jgi:hypothetical protein